METRQSGIEVELESDPVPVVKIMGARFRRACRSPAFVRRLQNFHGSFALASPRDPRKLTIDIENGRIRLRRGVHENAGIIVPFDFDRLDEPDYAPRVKGIIRHPLMVLRITRLLDFPKADWREAARRFWTHTRNLPYMPSSIKVVNEDDGQALNLGDGQDVEIHGTAKTLIPLFDGSAILIRQLMKRRISVVGNLKDIAALGNATQQMMLGEIDCEY